MKLTGKHKIYLAVAGLGVMALILDRTVFAPEDARGGERENHQVQLNAPPEKAGTSRGGLVDTEPLSIPSKTASQVADHLRHIAASQSIRPEDIRDAFLPGKSWFSDDGVQASKFQNRNKLIGVILGAKQSYARIELLWKRDFEKQDRFVTVQIDDTLDEYILIFLDSNSAVFELESERVALHLKK